MSPIRIVAVVLLLGGGASLAYGGFSFTKESHEAKIGPVELSVKDKERVDIPQWIAAAAVGSGALLLFLGDRKNA